MNRQRRQERGGRNRRRRGLCEFYGDRRREPQLERDPSGLHPGDVHRICSLYAVYSERRRAVVTLASWCSLMTASTRSCEMSSAESKVATTLGIRPI